MYEIRFRTLIKLLLLLLLSIIVIYEILICQNNTVNVYISICGRIESQYSIRYFGNVYAGRLVQRISSNIIIILVKRVDENAFGIKLKLNKPFENNNIVNIFQASTAWVPFREIS